MPVLSAGSHGSAPVSVSLLPWSDCHTEATAIRHVVFVQEQGVSPEEEMDDNDGLCLHALARDADGRAVGTGRLLPDGRIGRMAVLSDWRGSGVGQALLLALVGAARQRGLSEVGLSAQLHAQDFYARQGFVAEGDVYEDAGIAHITMRRVLRDA